MSEIIQVRANSAAIATTNNSVNASKLVRILNTGATVALITQFDTVANTQTATYQMAANSVIILEKDATDVLTSNHATNV